MSDATPDPTRTAAPNATWDPAAKPAPAAKERGFVADLLLFAWENKLWWIVPSVLILVGLGLMVFLSSNDGFAPFFYALF